ncbi:GTPase-activating protein [Tilletia horrida]|uniref:GTPase-activating protein n=1 Tax=Tilletia horrida TaxID=155126 RepID=A0AAN6GTR2_9BASI|nr:GTPase-activating protein [Tilletia horrida]KAK0568444.1 GTPase-activating protein [Tilletia horrida]
MYKTVQETTFGQILYYLSGRKVFPYPEDEPGYQPPEQYLPGYQSNEKQQHQSPLERPPAPQRIESTQTGTTGPFVTPPETPSLERAFNPTRTDSDDATLAEEGRVGGKSGKASPRSEQPGDGQKEKEEENPYEVKWSDDDEDLPLNWSVPKKCWVTFCVCALTFGVYAGSSIVSPGIESISSSFGVGLPVAGLSLTLFVFGYGIGPLILSPLSEIPQIGRNWPYIITLAIFVALQVPTILTTSPAGFFICRFLSGFFGSPALATGGATIGDMFGSETRPIALGIWGLSAVCGPTLGPLIGGFAFDHFQTYRWTLWPLLWLSGGVLIFLIFAMPETSASNILTRRARRLRRVTGNKELRSTGEIQSSHMTGSDIAKMTLVRPFAIAFLDPQVLALNMYIALVYACLYCWFESFAIVFTMTYGFNGGETGLAYMGLFVSAILTYIGYVIFDRLYTVPLMRKNNGFVEPEERLVPAMFGCFFLPLCLFSFGWTANASIHWIVPILCSSLFSVGVFLLFQGVLNYLADAYPDYQASVLAGNDTMRSLIGGAFPIFATAMFRNLQKNGPSAFPVAWGCTLLGGISVLMIPLPYLLYKYGKQIRAHSKFATHQ